MNDMLSKSPPAVEIGTSRWTEPFWAAAREHRLVISRCASCGEFRMPPTPFCPHCRSQEIDWVEPSGRGIVYSYTVVVKPMLPGMDDCVPYVPAVIELPDANGTKLISNIIRARIGDLRVGRPVRVAWDDQPGDSVVVPRFELCD